MNFSFWNTSETSQRFNMLFSGSSSNSNVPINPRPFPLRLITAGLIIVILFSVLLIFWSYAAPIDSAVISPGIIGVSSHRKHIQHLEGGIVDNIYVNDGERVQKGQLLIKLRDVHQKSNLRQLERQYIEAQVVAARLVAELNNDETIDYPVEILKISDDISINSVINGQNGMLASIRAVNLDKLAVLQNKIKLTKQEITGIDALLESKHKQRSFIKQELSNTQQAIEKNLIPKTKIYSLHERLAGINGEISSYISKKSLLEQTIHELHLQISEFQSQYVSDVTDQLRMKRALSFELSQKIISAQDILDRTNIRSPIDGIVVNLQAHTLDGVIEAGDSILEIVPTEDKLVVHAFVNPNDIDEVRPGMHAVIELTAQNRRQREPLLGVVKDISADRLSNPETGQDYYRAKIELNPALSSSTINLIPGMGAEVFIRTGSRTPVEYLLSPITKSLQLGMREQ